MAGLRVVVVACDSHGYIELDDLRAKAQQHRDALAALMVTYPSTYGIFEERIREICAIVHEHGGQVYMDGANMNAQVGPDEPGVDRRGRLPPEPAQDVRDPARRRRPRHGADRRGEAPRAVPAGPPRGAGRRRQGDPGDLGGAMGQRQHPADLVRLHPDARRRRHDRRDARRDPQRQLHQGAARGALRRALREPQRPRRARDDLRPAPVQARRAGASSRRAGRGEAADGLRLPRADRLVPGGGDDDDRADGERAERRSWIASATR